MQTDVHSRCGTDVHSHCGVRTHGTAWQLDIRIHFTVYPGPSIDCESTLYGGQLTPVEFLYIYGEAESRKCSLF